MVSNAWQCLCGCVQTRNANHLWQWSEALNLSTDLYIYGGLPWKVSPVLPYEELHWWDLYRILLTCMKYLSNCLCPRCLIKKPQIPDTGTRADDRSCGNTHNDSDQVWNSIANMCKLIFVRGIGVTRKRVRGLLNGSSLSPNHVCNTRL